jgi:hypothetical protein
MFVRFQNNTSMRREREYYLNGTDFFIFCFKCFFYQRERRAGTQHSHSTTLARLRGTQCGACAHNIEILCTVWMCGRTAVLLHASVQFRNRMCGRTLVDVTAAGPPYQRKPSTSVESSDPQDPQDPHTHRGSSQLVPRARRSCHNASIVFCGGDSRISTKSRPSAPPPPALPRHPSPLPTHPTSHEAHVACRLQAPPSAPQWVLMDLLQISPPPLYMRHTSLVVYRRRLSRHSGCSWAP